MLERTFIFDDLYKYYVTENHSAEETTQYFNTRPRCLSIIMNNYGAKKPKVLSYEWNKKTLKERYDFETYNNMEKSKKTCLERYGVDNYFKLINKIVESHIKTISYTYPMQNPEIKEKASKIEKSFHTHIKNGTTNTSKPESEFYDWLCNTFGGDKAEREYVDKERYPWHCDFYLKDKNIFIELNLFFTHSSHLYDSHNEEDQNKLKLWESKAKDSTYYKNAIKVWTERDPQKIKKAKENNLNYYIAYSLEDIY